ncbi:MAG: deoxynucleoside kinase, partial [Tissierellales bacterium]|nr:deoxynucleoside kinase [Tissierellales bacterium]
MKIVYASCSSSKSTFYKLFNESQTMPGQQVQKYHRLLMEGMIKNNATVISLTALPINKENCTKKIIRLSDEVENGILYKYIPIINLKYIKNLIIFLNSFVSTMRIFSKDKSSVLFCDVLNISVSSGALLASKI